MVDAWRYLTIGPFFFEEKRWPQTGSVTLFLLTPWDDQGNLVTLFGPPVHGGLYPTAKKIPACPENLKRSTENIYGRYTDTF
jgi:hypothetical protein